MDIYNLWRNVKDQTVSENTVAKYNSDRKRFFDGKDLSKMDIREIDSLGFCRCDQKFLAVCNIFFF